MPATKPSKPDSSDHILNYPTPWTLETAEFGGLQVCDANGKFLCWCHDFEIAEFILNLRGDLP